jgi:orotidine-5'-phosphate decarboxylase
LIVALDFSTLEVAKGLAQRLTDTASGFKVGLELLTSAGARAVEEIASLGKPVFADAKLHDIPNTVERAASNLASAGARWLTVHSTGGADMIEAARAGMGGEGVLGVTLLTSLTDSDLETIGVTTGPSEHVAALARLAAGAGAEGLVCSPAELAAVSGLGLYTFTPGVRPAGSDEDDQRRVATPEEAVKAGADYLVIGRPITRAEDPVAAAGKIAASIAGLRA